jgi:hypothetical protein
MIGEENYTIRADMYSPWRVYTPFRFYHEKFMVPTGVHYRDGQCYWMLALIEKSKQGNCYYVYSLN